MRFVISVVSTFLQVSLQHGRTSCEPQHARLPSIGLARASRPLRAPIKESPSLLIGLRSFLVTSGPERRPAHQEEPGGPDKGGLSVTGVSPLRPLIYEVNYKGNLLIGEFREVASSGRSAVY